MQEKVAEIDVLDVYINILVPLEVILFEKQIYFNEKIQNFRLKIQKLIRNSKMVLLVEKYKDILGEENN